MREFSARPGEVHKISGWMLGGKFPVFVVAMRVLFFKITNIDS
jgi:hypothetical protein